MGSTFFSLHYHIVFSTKERVPFIKAEWRPRVHSYLGGIIRGMNGVAEIVDGVADHVHLLASLRPVHCIADVMRDMKKDSSTWVKENFDQRFSWQEGYGAFSYSKLQLPQLARYIENQEQHHKKINFMDEYREILQHFEIEFDERFLFKPI